MITYRRVIIVSALVLILTSSLPAAVGATIPLPPDMQAQGQGPYPYLFPDTDGYFIHPNCLSSLQNTPDSSGQIAVPCGLTEILITAINITKAILALVGSVTLLMFIYGGFLWLMSAGNAEQIKKGRTVFVNAIIGLVIIFCSTIIINFVVAALTGQNLGSTINLFPSANPKPVLTVPTATSSQ